MARTSITGYQRQYGSNGKSATPAVNLNCIQFTFDSAQASTTLVGKTLPRGAIVAGAQTLTTDVVGGARTVDIGITGTVDEFANELDAAVKTTLVNTGTGTSVALTADAPITAGTGATTTGTGNVTVGVYYIMEDDGSA